MFSALMSFRKISLFFCSSALAVCVLSFSRLIRRLLKKGSWAPESVTLFNFIA